MSDLTHRLETGPWIWEIYEAAWPWNVLSSGEAQTFDAALAAMILKGLAKEQQGTRLVWHYQGKKVFIKFERVPDGFTIRDWGMDEEEQFPPKQNKAGE